MRMLLSDGTVSYQKKIRYSRSRNLSNILNIIKIVFNMFKKGEHETHLVLSYRQGNVVFYVLDSEGYCAVMKSFLKPPRAAHWEKTKETRGRVASQGK